MNQDWWGVSALAAFNFNDAGTPKLALATRTVRATASIWLPSTHQRTAWICLGLCLDSSGVDYDTWAVLGGIYYDPVPQLTLGLEAEWYTTETSFSLCNASMV